MSTITVAGAAPYDVQIGRGVLSEVSARLGSAVRKVLIVHQFASSRREFRLTRCSPRRCSLAATARSTCVPRRG